VFPEFGYIEIIVLCVKAGV